jgi:putative endonuclease
LYQHRYGELDGFAKRYHLTRLVWLEHFRNVNDAIACEKKLKGWRRSRKIALIEEMNPRWLDLSDDWEQQPKFYDVPGRWRKWSEMESLASRTSFAALQLRFAQNDIG